MFRLQMFTLVALLLCSASQPAVAQFVAELPSGATVELVAVVDLQAEPLGSARFRPAAGCVTILRT